ncbi:YfhO family protein [Candidatus Roizmanbacteria bacterium]|nr:YfhO family protein [Candidatus Roizmanbacteria bacterium]
MKKWLIPLVYILCIAYVMQEPLFHPERSLAGIDLKLANVHWRAFTKFELLNGRIPLWNGFINSGQPFLAHPESALFYPFTLVYLFLPVSYAMTLLVAFHLFIAAFAMERLSFYLIKDRFASFLSGISYMLSGYFVAKIYAGHLSSLFTAALIPIVLYLFFKSWLEKTKRYVLHSALALTLLIFAGFPETTAYFGLYVLLIICLFSISAYVKKSHIKWREFIFPFRVFLIVFILAFFIGAVQLLPSLEYVRQTTRAAGVPYEEANLFSLSPQDLPNLFSPSFYKNHIGSTFPLWESMNYFGRMTLIMVIVAILTRLSPFAFAATLGIISYAVTSSALTIDKTTINASLGMQTVFLAAFLLLLILYFVLFRNKKHSEMWPLVFVLTAVIGFLLSLGEFLPFRIYQVLWKFIPIFKLFRIPSHFLLFTLISVCVLAGYGINRIRSKTLKYIILLIATIDFLVFAKPYMITDTAKTFPIDSRLTQSFAQFDKNYRFYHSYGAYTEWGNLMSLFDPNSAISERVESLKGSDTLILKSYADFASIIDGRTIIPFSSRPIDVVIDNYNSPLLDLLSTRYFMMLPYEADLSSVNPRRFRTIIKTDRFNLYENVNSMPKGTMIYQVVRKATNEAVVEYMRSSDFKYDKEVVVEENVYHFLENITNREKTSAANVKLLSRSPTRTLFEVTTDLPGLLLTSDLYYPGWKAKLDGKKNLPVIKADYALRGIVLPAGKYRVEMYYLPESLILGGIVTLLTFGLGGVYILKKR